VPDTSVALLIKTLLAIPGNRTVVVTATNQIRDFLQKEWGFSYTSNPAIGDRVYAFSFEYRIKRGRYGMAERCS
jgi:hypothetical protein